MGLELALERARGRRELVGGDGEERRGALGRWVLR